ncbi:MAG: EpsI family protein [Proteobacteria bacterium]|nr:EpsI family protein [Pseudomonadota bacterium]
MQQPSPADDAGLIERPAPVVPKSGLQLDVGLQAATAPTWRAAFLVLAVGFAGMGFLFWDPVVAAVNVWIGSATYNHCFLVIPIVAYLIWPKWPTVARMAPRPAFGALALMPPIGLVWLIGHFASFYEAQHFAIVGLAQAFLLSVLGWRIYKTLLFPLLYLFFLVPSGEFIVPQLQDITGMFAVGWLRLAGVPVYQEGIFLAIPNGRFEIAEACAGIRFLIASIAYGFLFAYVMYRSYWRRAAFIALSIGIPIVANGFRAFGIVYLAYASNNQIAVGADHIIYGWFFFTIVTLAITAMGLMFRDSWLDDEDGTATAPQARLADAGPRPVLAAAAAGFLLIAAAPAYAAYAATHVPRIDPAMLAVPTMASPWAAAATTADSWTPVSIGADAELRRDFVAGSDRVAFYVAYYVRQRQGAKVISFDNRLYDEKDWHRLGSADAAELVIDGQKLTAAADGLIAQKQRRLVWYWYWVDGRFTASRATAKLLQARAELLGGQRGAAIIAVAADYDEKPEDAVRALRRFTAALGPLGPALERVVGR